MALATYNKVISDIKSLKLSDQLRLLEETATLIRKKTNETSSRSIMELKGKGKEIWQGINVKKYINEERSSWNG